MYGSQWSVSRGFLFPLCTVGRGEVHKSYTDLCFDTQPVKQECKAERLAALELRSTVNTNRTGCLE